MIAAIIALTLTNLATIAYIFWLTTKHQASQDKLTHALISKTAQDYINMEMTTKVKPISTETATTVDRDLATAVEDLTDEEFEKFAVNEQQ